MQAGSQIASPGCHALAKMLTRNTTLRTLSVFWAGADHAALSALAAALASNSTLTSLALGDPRSLSAKHSTHAACAVLSNASPQLCRLELSYVSVHSPASAQRLAAALRCNEGAEELCLPYLSIKYSTGRADAAGPPQAKPGDDAEDMARTEEGASALLGAALRARRPALRALELPFMHVRAAHGAHAALLGAALQEATALATLDMLQVSLWALLACVATHGALTRAMKCDRPVTVFRALLYLRAISPLVSLRCAGSTKIPCKDEHQSCILDCRPMILLGQATDTSRVWEFLHACLMCKLNVSAGVSQSHGVPRNRLDSCLQPPAYSAPLVHPPHHPRLR